MAFLRKLFLVLALAVAPFVTFADSDHININTADEATLAAIDGVGDMKAKEIVSYREQNGPFKSVKDLLNVKGIGESILENNKDRLTVGEKGDSDSSM